MFHIEEITVVFWSKESDNTEYIQNTQYYPKINNHKNIFEDKNCVKMKALFQKQNKINNNGGKEMSKKGFKVSMISLLALVLLIFTACSSGASGGSDSGGDGKNKEFKFGSMDAPDHVQNSETFTQFSEDVKELTDGRVSFQMFTGGSLGGPKETLDNLTTGIMDVGRGIHGYNAGKFEVQSVMNLPFLADGNAAELSVVTQKLHDTFPEIQEEYSDVKLLWVHAADPYAIITKGKQVKSFEDVKGLKA